MMKKFTILLFAAILSLGFLVSPAILEARGGHGGHGGHGGRGGHHGGFHGGYRGGSHGGHYGGFYGGFPGGFYRGYRIYGGPIFGFGAPYYLAPWGWYYPGYYPEYYYYTPPTVYDQPPAIEAPPPEYVEPPPATQDPGTGDIFTPPTTSQIPPKPNQRRCQIWKPTGEYHNESRWNPQKQAMETVSVPNFAWQDYPCE
jgi:hypothetical protein